MQIGRIGLHNGGAEGSCGSGGAACRDCYTGLEGPQTIILNDDDEAGSAVKVVAVTIFRVRW